VVVEDPNHDAYTADEWKEYFSTYGEVAAVTVLLDNYDLLSRYALRRRLRKTMLLLPKTQWWPELGKRWRRRLQGLGLGKDRIFWMEKVGTSFYY
jgi:hypothetical protein